MNELDIVEEFTDAVLRAGTRPELWDAVPAVIQRHFPETFASLMGDDSRGRMLLGCRTAGLAPRFVRAYQEHFHALNPWLAFWEAAPGDVALTADGAAPAARFAGTEFYQDWLVPAGGTSGTGLKLLQNADSQILLHLNYPSRLAALHDGPLVRIITAARPSLRAAIELNRHLAGEGDAVPGGTDALIEANPLPAILVDASARILATNAPARAVLSGDGPLRDLAGVLTVRGPGLSPSRLAETIRDAALRIGPSDKRIRIPDEDGRLRGLISVWSMAQPDRPDGLWLLGRNRRALVLLRGYGTGRPETRRLLGELHGLTRAETEVAMRLAAGLTLAELSDALAISNETARKHLKRIFEKTGCRRQAEVVAAVLMLS